MAEQPTWQRVESRIAYENPWTSIREDKVIRPDGSPGLYGVVVGRPSVIIAGFTDDGQIILTNQYRYPIERFIWELPGGGTDGQPPLEAAKREFWEETGFEAERWEEAAVFYPMSGLLTETCYVFCAYGLRQTDSHAREEEGIGQVRPVPVAEIQAMITAGDFLDGQSLAALLLALKTHGSLKLR